jgi:iron(III) transport system substrate-binding protein
MRRIPTLLPHFPFITTTNSARLKVRPWPLFTILILAVLFAGCSSAVESEIVPASISAEKLTIYSGRSSSLVDPIIQQFGQATGIEIAVKYANTAQLAATLLEEGDRTPADIFFAQDPGGLGAVEHMLAPLDATVLEQVPDWARSPEGKWVGLSGRARTVVYNTETLSEADLPDDMFGFTDPKWKGRIGWAPTNASFQTMVSAMNSMWGEEKTLRWLEGIQANDPKVYPKNTPQVAAVSTGEIDVGFVNHYYLFRFLAEEGESFPARNYHPRSGGPGATVMVAGAGVLAASENKEVAQRFLEFMLSKVGQQYFAGQTFEYPLVDGVTTPKVLIPLSGFTHPDIPVKDLGDLKGTQDLLRRAGVTP